MHRELGLERLVEYLPARTDCNSDQVGNVSGPVNFIEVGQMSETGAQTGVDIVIWPFDAAAWRRIQESVRQRAAGDREEIWHLINLALFFSSAEQQRQSLPSARQIRAGKQRLLETIESLMAQLGVTTAPSSQESFHVDGQVFGWLLDGAMRRLHPEGPRLGENARADRVPIHRMVGMLRVDYDEVQLEAQGQVLALLRQLAASLHELRELTAASLVETSSAQSRGSGTDLVRFAFVDYAALAYEKAYGRSAKPGRMGASDEAGPAVRFIISVADEVRRAGAIEPHHRELLKLALHVTPDTVRRLLGKRQAR